MLFLATSRLSPGDFSEAELKCYLVNAGRAAANWKKMCGNDRQYKVMNKYEECSGDFGRSKKLAPDPAERANEQFQHGGAMAPVEIWTVFVQVLLTQDQTAAAQGTILSRHCLWASPPSE